MSSLEAPNQFLATLAPQSAAAWNAIGSRVYPGELSIATDNSVYRFRNGIFMSRAKKPARSFEAPKEMRGLRIIGFLREEGGRWSLSPLWRAGARAVMWKPEHQDTTAFILTSPTIDFTIEEPEPKPGPQPRPGPEPSPWATRSPARSPQSGVMLRRVARPPTFRRPAPPSTTRIHNALPALPALPAADHR